MAEHQITFEQAQSNLFDAAVYLGEAIADPNGHSAAMREIVPLYLARNDVDAAAAFADTIEDSLTRDRLLTLIAEKCAALDDDEYALQLADALEDSASRESARERVALQKADKNQFDQAFAIADSLAHPDYVYAAIAARMFQTDQTGATNLIEKIADQHAVIAAWLVIAAAEFDRGNSEQAIASIENAVRAADAISADDEEKVREFIAIADIYRQFNQKERAVLLLDRARKIIEEFDAARLDNWLMTLAASFLAAGSVELADRVLDLITDNVQMAQALLEFSEYYLQQDLPNDALEACEEAYQILRSQKDNQVRDSQTRFTVYANVAAQFAALDKFDRALEAAQENRSDEMQARALRVIAGSRAGRGRFENARQTLAAIDDDANRVYALIGAADEAAKNEYANEAANFLSEAFELAETIPQMPPRSAALTAIAARFAQNGDTAKARQISLENLAVIRDIRDETSQANALAALSEFYAAKNFTLTESEKTIVSKMLIRATV